MPNRNKRRAYLDDFTKTASGEYVYSGAHEVWQAGEKGRARTLRRLWLLAAAGAIAALACGFLPGTGLSGTFYVLLPYIAEFCLLANGIWLLARLTGGGVRVRAYLHAATVRKMPGRAYAAAICAAAAFVGECVRMLAAHTAEGLLWEFLLLILQGIVAAVAVLSAKEISGLMWNHEQ